AVEQPHHNEECLYRRDSYAEASTAEENRGGEQDDRGAKDDQTERLRHGKRDVEECQGVDQLVGVDKGGNSSALGRGEELADGGHEEAKQKHRYEGPRVYHEREDEAERCHAA